MSILINKNTKVIIQGITGKEGQYHAKLMLEYGTKIVAGVTPGKGGQSVLGVPVFNTVNEAIQNTAGSTAIGGTNIAAGLFVPAKGCYEALKEAIDNGIKVVVLITEGIPLNDVLKLVSLAKRSGVTLIGPNTPGLLTADECKIGILSTHYVKKGSVGVISRSGTLTAEVCQNLTKQNIGQTTVIGIGGDPVIGTNFVDLLKLFEKDDKTKSIVIVGEVGGTLEEETAEFIRTSKYSKPVVAYIAGQNVPEGRRFGHAGAIVEGSTGTAKSKMDALKGAGVRVARVPWEIGKLL